MVNILISVYNGEAFIGQQIESILAQSYQNYHIYVRDDGSRDRSVKVIEQYLASNKVTLFQGENLGFARSFLELLQDTPEGDYWAFCDQDDVWHPDKIKWAVSWMDLQEKGTPCLFHSAYENVDINLNHINYYLPPKYKYDFQRALTECLYFGFSMMINASLRRKMLLADFSQIESHDWWAQLIAVTFGKTMFDSRVASKHRRHTNSVTLDNRQKKWEWAIGSFLNGNRIANNAKEFERLFSNDLNEQEKLLLSFFTHTTLKGNLIRAMYPKRWRPTFASEVLLRILMLLGKS